LGACWHRKRKRLSDLGDKSRVASDRPPKCVRACFRDGWFDSQTSSTERVAITDQRIVWPRLGARCRLARFGLIDRSQIELVGAPYRDLNNSAGRRILSHGDDEPEAAAPMTDPERRLYEQVLVLRCQTGDEAAFAELVGRFGPRLRYYIGKSFDRMDGAEDAYQDVWLVAFRRIRGLKEPAAFVTWLYRIAQNRVRQELRRRGRPARPIEEADEVHGPGGEPVEFSPEDAARIHAALDGLDLEHREVLMLRFLEHMTYEQIATSAGCGVGTVKSRLYYAKRALRRILDSEKIYG
jgi:RNA polymerase sigma-70 factor (ECF subfamily)